MNNEIYDFIKIIGSCLGYALSAVTLTTIIVKPLRNKFINWVRQTSDIDNTNSEIAEIKAMLKQHIETDADKQETLIRLKEAEKANLRNSILQLCDKCIKRESITAIEKMNLMDMYQEYHNLGGDSYCTDRYIIAKELPEIG